MILWTTSTGDAGAADTRTRAAHEATTAVLAHWGNQHPYLGGAEGVTICVDDTDAEVGPGLDADGRYDPATTAELLHRVRDQLAQPTPDAHPSGRSESTGPSWPGGWE